MSRAARLSSRWLGILFAAAAGGQVLDRIAVTVGKTVITESEVLTHLKVAAFLDQKEPDLSGPSKRRAAERLVDQVLLRKEVPGDAVAETAMEAVAQLKKRYQSEAEYRAALDHYGITERDIALQLANGVESVDASNRRFRPEVQVTDDEVRAEYDKLAREWRAKNVADVPSFEASRGQVQDLLVDGRVTDALEKWFEMARQQATIVYHEKVFE